MCDPDDLVGHRKPSRERLRGEGRHHLDWRGVLQTVLRVRARLHRCGLGRRVAEMQDGSQHQSLSRGGDDGAVSAGCVDDWRHRRGGG